MNYKELYKRFVDHWKNQEIPNGVYTEVHHIVPKHSGGKDNEDNLVRLTYRQHVFAHRLLWKAYKKPQDLMVWKLMSAIEGDRKFALCQMAGQIGGAKNRESGHMSSVGKKHGPIIGKRHAESGWLDSIRHLANNDKQREWASKLGKENVKSGQLDKARNIALKNLAENGMSEKRKEALDKHNEHMKTCPKAKENCRKAAEISRKNKIEKTRQRVKDVIENSENNEEFLKVKPRGKYWYVSPEGLKFGTSIAAARYYGNGLKDYDVQNWCKREFEGWHLEDVIR